jgi:hypothetical protein
MEHTRARRSATSPHTDHTAKTHDFILFKSPLDSLMGLAQTRLLGIIRNRKHLVDALPGYCTQLLMVFIIGNRKP